MLFPAKSDEKVKKEIEKALSLDDLKKRY